MKLRNIVYSAVTLLPTLAAAHPGHTPSALHLHLGAPDALNSFNPELIAAGLFLGTLFVSRILLKKR
jgi:hypothetical protein